MIDFGMVLWCCRSCFRDEGHEIVNVLLRVWKRNLNILELMSRVVVGKLGRDHHWFSTITVTLRWTVSCLQE
jgi:hypothetical protein